MYEHKDKLPEKIYIGLKRELGLVSAVNFLINVIVGSGIFISPGKVLAECGSVGLMLTVWVLCGIIAFMTCLPFGELSTVVPKSGGIYIYLHTAFSSYHPFFGELPAFIYIWIMYVIVEPCSTAVSAVLFADYSFVILQQFMSKEFLHNEALIKHSLGTLALVLIGVINCVSVKLYVKSQDLLTYTKMGAIVFTVGCGVYMFISGKANDFDTGFKGTHLSASQLTQALYFGLYAYDGGWAITGITEELKRPEKNITYSIIIALSITTATYLLLNLTFLTALTSEEIANGTTVIADFANKIFGSSGAVISAGTICLCLLTSIMSSIFYSSRLGYVAAREGHMVETLSYIHKTRQTPAPAVVILIMLSLLYFFVGGNVTFLIDMCQFFMWMSYGAAMVALFILRKKFPHAYRPFRVPSAIPVIVIMVSSGLVVISLLITDQKLLMSFIGCVVFVISMYYIFIYKAFRIKNFDVFQKRLQTLLMLVPPSNATAS